MTIVVDASVVIAALIDDGRDGRWAEEILETDQLVAPHLLPVECANVLRRAALAGDVSNDMAAIAHADLLHLRIELFPYEPFADRIWELHRNVTAYDAWYIALAEALKAPLATLDTKLAKAPGLRCRFRTRAK